MNILNPDIVMEALNKIVYTGLYCGQCVIKRDSVLSRANNHGAATVTIDSKRREADAQIHVAPP